MSRAKEICQKFQKSCEETGNSKLPSKDKSELIDVIIQTSIFEVLLEILSVLETGATTGGKDE